MFLILFILLFIENYFVFVSSEKPNIVLIIADDMGWNDVSFHGSNQFLTPNIDALAYNGVILNKHYTMHICTPSRTALLTGNHPVRSGMQGYPLRSGEPRALPLNMPTLAQRLAQLGYYTHLVGKWHLGHQARDVTPIGRGFHTHLGYWNGFVGYFDYEIHEPFNANGFDLHRNFHPEFKSRGIYATDLFTDEAVNIINSYNHFKPMFLMVSHLAPHTGKNGTELEVPNTEEAMDKFKYITEPQRRLYAEIVVRLDESVGRIVKSLAEKEILNNTIVIFLSDNGAQTTGLYQNAGSNWPLRGLKFTLFEGGLRNVGVIWSSLLKRKQYVDNDNIYHIIDWLPTLYAAAGGDIKDLGQIDGVNHWPTFSQGRQVKRSKNILLNIDDVTGHDGILSSEGRFKLVKGTFQNGIYDGYFGDSGRTDDDPLYNITTILNCDVNKAILSTKIEPSLTTDKVIQLRKQTEVPVAATRNNISCLNYCLFDLWNDPTESLNILTKHNPKFLELKTSLDLYRLVAIPQKNKPVDPKSNPVYCNGTWFNWLDKKIKCVL